MVVTWFMREKLEAEVALGLTSPDGPLTLDWKDSPAGEGVAKNATQAALGKGFTVSIIPTAARPVAIVTPKYKTLSIESYLSQKGS